MEHEFTVPPEYKQSFQRLLPHMTAGLRNDHQELEAVYLYLKLGGEKLARIAIDAFNQTHRLKNAQMQRLRLEQSLLAEQMEAREDELEEENEGEKAGTGNEDDEIPDY
ncbi:MAG: hypothetical protein C4519_10265 [Desulfobacteraceae bacterium]|nr:MAG: hypothetical protein C4519_10265 [Desulfobacteraceae bacterium]